MTPASATASYCTGAQCIKFYDVRQIGDLLTDDDTRVAAGSVAAHPNLTAELNAASGEVESAVLVGGRYSVADLQALQSANSVGGEYLAKMVAVIAVWNLMERRNPDVMMPDRVRRVYESLEKLRTGENIFGFIENIAAGVTETVKLYQDQQDEMRSPVKEAARMFGNRTLTDY